MQSKIELIESRKEVILKKIRETNFLNIQEVIHEHALDYPSEFHQRLQNILRNFRLKLGTKEDFWRGELWRNRKVELELLERRLDLSKVRIGTLVLYDDQALIDACNIFLHCRHQAFFYSQYNALVDEIKKLVKDVYEAQVCFHYPAVISAIKERHHEFIREQLNQKISQKKIEVRQYRLSTPYKNISDENKELKQKLVDLEKLLTKMQEGADKLLIKEKDILSSENEQLRFKNFRYADLNARIINDIDALLKVIKKHHLMHEVDVKFQNQKDSVVENEDELILAPDLDELKDKFENLQKARM